MSLMDVIDSLASDEDVPVTRRTGGAYVDGVWVPGTNVTVFFLPSASIQPATGQQRVVGGADMRQDETNQFVYDLREIYTYIELKPRQPGIDPDQVEFEGRIWVVTRSETWTLNDEVIYRALMTKETRGAT